MAIESNHAKAISFIRNAASQGAHLAVLPEYHLTNWLPDDPNFINLCSQSQKYLEAYQALAKELNSKYTQLMCSLTTDRFRDSETTLSPSNRDSPS